MSAEITIESPEWLFVELGRVVMINKGDYAGKLATIVEIIDHRRVLVDGPQSGVPRQGVSLKNVDLTELIVPEVTQGASTDVVAKQWVAAEISKKWSSSEWAERIKKEEKRSQLNDFERFQVSVLKNKYELEVSRAAANTAS